MNAVTYLVVSKRPSFSSFWMNSLRDIAIATGLLYKSGRTAFAPLLVFTI
jgi:hypothetical protein